MTPYLVDLRTRVVSAVEAGQSCHKAAACFGVSASTATKVIRPKRGRRRRLLPAHAPPLAAGRAWPIAALAMRAWRNR